MRLYGPLLFHLAATETPVSSTRLLPTAITGGCWDAAFRVLRRRLENSRLAHTPPNQDDPCSTFDDSDKKMMAISMANCHVATRGRDFSAHADCDFENGLIYSEQTIAICLKTLNDFTFQLYMELYNHLESVCFHIHAALWQKRAELLMSDLSMTAGQVVAQLDTAHAQHEELIFGQQIALQHQQTLISDSVRLQQAFGDIQEEVSREHAQVRQVFGDLFEAFHKITQFHSFLRGQLFDLQTCLIYGFLVFLSHYMTTSPKTASARAELYLLWTGMALFEFAMVRAAPFLVSVANGGWPVFRALLGSLVSCVCSIASLGANRGWRWAIGLEKSNICDYNYEVQLRGAETIAAFYTVFEDERTLAKSLIGQTRWVFAAAALYLYCRAYWKYQDPQKQALKSVTDHIDKLHTRLETRVLKATVNTKDDPLGKLLGDSIPASPPANAKNFVHGSGRAIGKWLPLCKSKETPPPAGSPNESDEGRYKTALLTNPRLRKWLADENAHEFMARVESNAMTSKYIMANDALS